MGGACSKAQAEPPSLDAPEADEDAKRAALQSGRGRRTSVSAEATSNVQETYIKKKFPKTHEQRARIQTSIQDNFLFSQLDDEQMQEIIDAMFEKKVCEDEEVITMGDWGDNFYVIEEGEFDVFLKSSDRPVFHYKPGDSFGELALMYNSPRAATVKAVSNSVLWCVDRITFRHIIIQNQQKRREELGIFLAKVPLLANLTEGARDQLADFLAPHTVKGGEAIITEGAEYSSTFKLYFVKEGSVQVSTAKNGVISALTVGSYFGERALLNQCARSATVTALGNDVRLLRLDSVNFERMLVDVKGVMMKRAEKYLP